MMIKLLTVKEYLKVFVGKYEAYLVPLAKFITALVVFMSINGQLGYMDKLKSMSVVLVVSLLASLLPWNFMLVAGAAFILLHMYELSLECAAVVLVVFLLLFLLYFRFTPKESLVVLLTPVCFVLKIPYVVPVVMGLIGGPVSVISVSGGVIVYYVLAYMSNNQNMLAGMETENAIPKFQNLIDGLLHNREMVVVIAAFAVTVLVVYIVRRLSIDYAWSIAMGAGALTCLVILLLGEMMYDLQLSIVGILLGTVVSLAIAKVIQFFVLNLDYTRTEKVQFEDDEYYYYVKAVPKITVATPAKTVKKINTPKRGMPVKQVKAKKTSSKGKTIKKHGTH